MTIIRHKTSHPDAFILEEINRVTYKTEYIVGCSNGLLRKRYKTLANARKAVDKWIIPTLERW